MLNTKRAALSIAVIAALGFAAVGCGDDDGEGSSTTAAAGTTAAAPATTAGGAETTAAGAEGCKAGTPAAPPTLSTDGAKLEGTKVGLMFDVTGRGDKSFNDLAAKGADLAVAEMGIVLEESVPVAADGSDRTPRLQAVIENGNELIIGTGFLWSAPLGPEAAANPDLKFVEIDGIAVDDNGTPSDTADDKPLTNTRNVIFAEHQGSFLVGVAAACASKTGKIGFIGGVEVPSIQKFQAGFEAGVHAVNPDATVDAKYLTQVPDFTGFNDPAKGKATAAAMYASGIDVIFHAAGGSGKGLFEAAKESGKPAGDVYAIGVDSDQYFQVADDIKPYILTSMVKQVDLAVIDFLKSVADGSFKAERKDYDLRDGIGYSGSNKDIEKFAGTIEEWKTKIINGEVTVPEKLG